MARKFENMSKQNQKMRIVEDAIAQIQLGKIIPTNSEYFRLLTTKRNQYDKSRYEYKNKQSIQEILALPKVTCEACAKGALFAACVIDTNEVNGKDLKGGEDFMKDKLSKWFSPLELDMIETAFERTVIVDTTNSLQDRDTIETKLGMKCIKFGIKHGGDLYEDIDSSKLMLAILNNILIHGEFKP